MCDEYVIIKKNDKSKYMNVEDIMTINVEVVEEDTPVRDIAEKLIERGFTGMPVVKNEQIVGIVTEDDLIMQEGKIQIPEYVNILTSFLYLDDPDDVGDDLKKILATSAKELMTDEVVTINPEATVEDLVILFKKYDVNPVPVEKNGKLIGIVSRADVVMLLAKPRTDTV